MADLGYEFESFVNDERVKKREFDFGPKSPSIAYKSFLEFLLEMQGRLDLLRGSSQELKLLEEGREVTGGVINDFFKI